MGTTWKKKTTEPTYTSSVPETITGAKTATTSNNTTATPITVDPTGVTKGVYGSYSLNTIPVVDNTYDKKAQSTLGSLERLVRGGYNDPTKADLTKYQKLVSNPGEFSSEWEAFRDKYGRKLDEEYDPNSDPTYLAYKNQYTKGGMKAMQDTLAKAAALTGGYGSSYGQSAGQQTYNDYMTALADKIPELAQAAYEMNLGKLNAYNNLYGQDFDIYNSNRNYNLSALGALTDLGNYYSGLYQNQIGNLGTLYNAQAGMGDTLWNRMQDEYGIWGNAMANLTAAASGGSGGSGGGGRSGSSKESTPETIVNNHSMEGGWVDVPTMGKQSLSSLKKLVQEGKVIETKTKDGYVYSPAKNDSRVRYPGLQ